MFIRVSHLSHLSHPKRKMIARNGDWHPGSAPRRVEGAVRPMAGFGLNSFTAMVYQCGSLALCTLIGKLRMAEAPCRRNDAAERHRHASMSQWRRADACINEMLASPQAGVLARLIACLRAASAGCTKYSAETNPSMNSWQGTSPWRPASASGSCAAPRAGSRLILPNTRAFTKSTFQTWSAGHVRRDCGR